MNLQNPKRYLHPSVAASPKSIFVDVTSKDFDPMHHCPSFIGNTGEDVWQCYNGLAVASCFRFGVYPDKTFPDIEETLDVARLLCSVEAPYVPVVPLEPSSFMALQHMRPFAIEVQLCFPNCNDQIIKEDLLRYLSSRSKYPVWVQGDELTEEQIAIALNCGCVAAILPLEG